MSALQRHHARMLSPAERAGAVAGGVIAIGGGVVLPLLTSGAVVPTLIGSALCAAGGVYLSIGLFFTDFL